MQEATTITQDDAVRLVQIMAKVAAVDGDHTVRKRLLLDEVCRLIDADRWNWALNSVNQQGEPRHVGVLQGGFTLQQAEKLTAGAHHPESVRTFAPSYMSIKRLGEAIEQGESLRPITVRLEDHPLYPQWQRSEAAAIMAQGKMGTFISSVCPMDKNQSSSVTLFRAPGREPFTPRQRDLVHVLMRGVIWLHTDGWPEEANVTSTMELSAGHTATLTLLVKGYTRKQIAEARSLSINTVNSYTKQIFKHFEVRSQPELMRYFLHGPLDD